MTRTSKAILLFSRFDASYSYNLHFFQLEVAWGGDQHSVQCVVGKPVFFTSSGFHQEGQEGLTPRAAASPSDTPYSSSAIPRALCSVSIPYLLPSSLPTCCQPSDPPTPSSRHGPHDWMQCLELGFLAACSASWAGHCFHLGTFSFSAHFPSSSLVSFTENQSHIMGTPQVLAGLSSFLQSSWAVC